MSRKRHAGRCTPDPGRLRATKVSARVRAEPCMGDDFGTWLVAQAGSLPPDFELER